MSIENLKSIYRSFYEANLVAAEDDYLAYYERAFAPDSIGLDDLSDPIEVKDAICHLAEEIYNDTGSEETTREWLINAGAGDDLLAMCDL